MPSVERYISTPLSYKPLNPREFNDVKVDVVLEKTAMLSLQGILEQFAKTTEAAHSVFSNVFEEAQKTSDRLGKFSSKFSSLDKQIASLPADKLALKIFSKTEATEAQQETSQFLFTPASRPDSIRALYEQALPMPKFKDFDQFADGQKCSDLYSKPNFFMEQWIAEETKKQQEAEERRRKRKEARKQKKELKTQEEAKGKKTRIQVASVQKKKFNEFGAEFQETDVASLASPKGTPSDDPLPSVATEALNSLPTERKSFDSEEIRPSLIASSSFGHGDSLKKNMSSGILQAIPVTSLSSTAAPPGLPSVPSIPSLPTVPKLASMASLSSIPIPATLPNIPAAPSAPAFPPLTVQSPSMAAPPPIAAPSPAPGLLDAIKQGVALKKSEGPQSSTNTQMDLLAQIRAGKALKKVDLSAESKKKAEDEGTFGEIRKLMERRKFIEDSESEEDWS